MDRSIGNYIVIAIGALAILAGLAGLFSVAKVDCERPGGSEVPMSVPTVEYEERDRVEEIGEVVGIEVERFAREVRDIFDYEITIPATSEGYSDSAKEVGVIKPSVHVIRLGDIEIAPGITIADSLGRLVTKLRGGIETGIAELFPPVRSSVFCVDPILGVGIGSDIKFDWFLSVRFFNYKNFGLGVGSSRRIYGISMVKNISGFIPFVENTQFVMTYGKKYSDGVGAGFIGIGVEL